jgi:hypothetical protein
MIAHTAHFPGVSPETLYTAYLSSQEHSAMTAGSRPASFFRPGEGGSGFCQRRGRIACLWLHRP